LIEFVCRQILLLRVICVFLTLCDSAQSVTCDGAVRHSKYLFKLPLLEAEDSSEAGGITDLLLQVTKAADTADTTVTHSYFH